MKNNRVTIAIGDQDKLLLNRLSEELRRSKSGTIRWLIYEKATEMELTKCTNDEDSGEGVLRTRS